MPPLQHGITYTQVSAGTNHTVLLRSDGVAVACGRVGKGQCDIPPLPDRMTYTQVFAGHDVHTVLLRVMGRLRSVVEIFKFNATFHPCLTK
jgi:alpha-tubulin suppressor-like RCC1 family protein